MIDCDGANSAGNQEWFTIFGYNGTTAVNPTVTLSGGTELVQGLETVNATWHTFVDAEIAGAVPGFTTKRIAKNATSVTPALNDPDDLTNQALFDFGTNKVDHLFILWGIRNDLSAGGHALSGAQNSGVSPLVFSFDFDYGDAPNSYSTNKASLGPVHVIPAVPLLTLGTTVTTENNGSPGSLATGDTDDGITTIDSIHRRFAFPTDTIATYSLVVNYTNNSGSDAQYAAWIDWNNNGTFQASEGLTATSPAATTSGTVTFTWTSTLLTNHTSTDHTYARIRVTTEAITTANDRNAPFQDGEVEDYLIPFADASTPLPVKLISFNGQADNEQVSLNWEVADQQNVDYYEIQKSNNGADFVKIGSVKAAAGIKLYSLLDTHPSPGLNFYKLKSVDIDGNYQYSSSTVRLNLGMGNKQINIYPNPAKKTITVSREHFGTPDLLVYNSKGQLIIKKALISDITNIDISALKAGIYYFNVYDGKEKLSSEAIEIVQ